MKEFLIELEEFVLHVYCDDLDARIILHEAKHRGIPIGGPYSAQYHTAHTTRSQVHIHIYYKNNQLFALNKDGSAHDRTHGFPIPNKVVKGIRQHFPDFQIPPDQIIECATLEDEATLITESCLGSAIPAPPEQ